MPELLARASLVHGPSASPQRGNYAPCFRRAAPLNRATSGSQAAGRSRAWTFSSASPSGTHGPHWRCRPAASAVRPCPYYGGGLEAPKQTALSSRDAARLLEDEGRRGPILRTRILHPRLLCVDTPQQLTPFASSGRDGTSDAASRTRRSSATAVAPAPPASRPESAWGVGVSG